MTEVLNYLSEACDMHFTFSECCMDLIPQSEGGTHSLSAPIGPFATITEALNNSAKAGGMHFTSSDADGMHFTASECCMDLIPKSQEGRSQILCLLNGQCAFSVDSLNNSVDEDGMRCSSSERSMDLITQFEEGVHSLRDPMGQCASVTEAQSNRSDADCMHFTAPECCTNLMKQSEEGGAHSLIL
jgi:hypothetical protein